MIPSTTTQLSKISVYESKPCLIVWRCSMCDEFLYDPHEDWNRASQEPHPNMTHDCSPHPVYGGQSMGIAYHVGYILLKGAVA